MFAVRVGNAGQVVFRVVGVVRGMARRVGDAGQPVRVVIGIDSALDVLVRPRGPPPRESYTNVDVVESG